YSTQLRPTVSTLFPYTTLVPISDRGAQPVDGGEARAIVGLLQQKVANHFRRRRPHRSQRHVAELLEAPAVGAIDPFGRRRLPVRSEEHTSELQSPDHLVCRLLLE